MFAPTLDAPARKFRGDPPIASARHDVVIDLRSQECIKVGNEAQSHQQAEMTARAAGRWGGL